jgi:uncharacterized protein (DUF697 family)
MTITRAKKRPSSSSTSATGGTTDPAESVDAFISGANEPSPAVVGTSEVTAEISPPSSDKATAALAIVRRHMIYAGAAGLMPLPGMDIALVGAVQLKLVAALAKEYGVDFRETLAKSLISALMAGLLENALTGIVSSGVKVVPGIGTALGMVTFPAIAAAATCAVGKVFISHFETGGTLLDFEPESVKAHFRAEFERSHKAGAAA